MVALLCVTNLCLVLLIHVHTYCTSLLDLLWNCLLLFCQQDGENFSIFLKVKNLISGWSFKNQRWTHRIAQMNLIIQSTWGLHGPSDQAAKRSTTTSENNKSGLIIVLTCGVSRPWTANTHTGSKPIISQLQSIAGILLRRWVIEMRRSMTARQSQLRQVVLVERTSALQ